MLIKLETDGRQHVRQGEDRVPVFWDGDSFHGKVTITPTSGSELKHRGIRIELCGVSELCTGRWQRDEFLCLKQDLARPGTLSCSTPYPFEFIKASMPLESYDGSRIRVRYFLRVIVGRLVRSVTKEFPFVVYCPLPHYNSGDGHTRTSEGCDEFLAFNVIYKKEKYSLDESFFGTVHFKQFDVKVRQMELHVVRVETIAGVDKEETLEKFEIMDGEPSRGETIPFRLFLANYPLSPTLKDTNNRFSVRYYIHMYVYDESMYQFYSSLELLLYRCQSLSDGMTPSGNGQRDHSAVKPQAYGSRTLTDQWTVQVHSPFNGNSDKIDSSSANNTSDDDEAMLGAALSVDERVDVEAMTPVVLGGSGTSEIDQSEGGDHVTSDTDLQAGEEPTVAGGYD